MSRARLVLVLALELFAVAGPAFGAESGGGSAPSTIYAGVSVYRGSWHGTGSSCTWQAHNARTGADPPVLVEKVVDGVHFHLFEKRCPALEFVWIPDITTQRLSF